ncbi:SDR family NAD(P)-dependent oxidoreductase [Nannocystis bainbridge]|uniref:SDR family NAD(P)-dependent oxidoreductase n=1 Tax=Nannocystis bainbridge TaxID=2995303 RepID=A0ABT5E8Q7_9BACT|nr:SDR family NAD(P)-dependent oxidoreductase [Nannocystis bainbridge]MDC0721217.1 SDR family NAD(P)-dependent oxidoreductase [Nannocystis bainbridge]
MASPAAPTYTEGMTNDRKHAVVTGANKGIGLAVARQLAGLGYTTWLGSRAEARGRAAVAELAGHGDVRWLPLDVTDDANVAAAAALVGAATGRLDLLINNAAIGIKDGEGPPTLIRLEVLRATYEVNLFGPLRVTRAFLPLLRAAPAAQIVMVGSGLGSLALQSDPASGLSRWPVFGYNSSKTALNALTVALANELRPEGIAVRVVNPGFIATDLNDHSGTGTPDEGARMVLKATTTQAPSGSFVDGDGTLPW